MLDTFLVLLAFGLVLLNAFFVASEFGMVRLRSTRVQTIQENNGLRGYILGQVHSKLDEYLSACQLGITLASLGLGWVGEPAFAKLLLPVFAALGIVSVKLITLSAFIVAFGFITFLHIVVGELMPKSMAIRQPEVISLWTAVPLYAFYFVMFPFIYLLNKCSNFLLKRFGLDRVSYNENLYTIEELRLILDGSHSSENLGEQLSEQETKILEHTIDLTELEVTEVMRPAEEIIMLNINESVAVLLQEIAKYRYSRYPIFDPAQNTIVGVVHVKDLFSVLLQEKKIVNLTAVMRPILKVTHSLPAMDLLHKFREGMPHFALVYKGKDNLLGFVTLDNLLHVMIGRIKDEFHRTRDDWTKNADDSFSVKGSCTLYSLEQALDTYIDLQDGEEDIDTISGLLISRQGGIPKPGDEFVINEFIITVVTTDSTAIETLRVIRSK